jgi:hypothetical protein
MTMERKMFESKIKRLLPHIIGMLLYDSNTWGSTSAAATMPHFYY